MEVAQSEVFVNREGLGARESQPVARALIWASVIATQQFIIMTRTVVNLITYIVRVETGLGSMASTQSHK